MPGDPWSKASAILLDPSGSLGVGTTPIAGEWSSISAAPIGGLGSDDTFTMGLSAVGDPNFTSVSDAWAPGFLLSDVQAAGQGTVAALVPSLDGTRVIDLWQSGGPDGPPLFNPVATGPIDVGGLPLASPEAGALSNDLFDAMFHGDTTALTGASTLFDDWLGVAPSVGAGADGLLPGGV